MTEENLYKSLRIVDGEGSKPRYVIIDGSENIVNKNPNKEELKELKIFEEEFCKGGRIPEKKLLNLLKQFYEENGRTPMGLDFDNDPKYPCCGTYQKRFGSWNNALKLAGLYVNRHGYGESLNYNETNTCEFICMDNKRCNDMLYPNNARRFDINGKSVWFCERHGSIYRQKLPNSQHNIIKSLANCRTGNQDPNSSSAKGDRSQKLSCLEFEWVDLNKENNNYNYLIDCFDPRTGLFHQVRGRRYNSIERLWGFAPLEGEWNKKYEDMVCYCMSKDGKNIERIYIFPHSEINGRKSIAIYRNRTDQWCEQYRVKNDEELKKANEIWKEINNVYT